MATAKKHNKPKVADYERLGKQLETIWESNYANRSRLYKLSFIKGVIGGLGGVIGATIVLGLLLWFLTLFQDVPLIGRLVDNFQNTIESR